MTKQTLGERASETCNHGLVSVNFGAPTDNICFPVLHSLESFGGDNSIVVKTKLSGVKVKAFVLLSSIVIMLQAITTVVNLAMKTTLLFTNPSGNLWLSVTIPVPESY